MNPFISPIAAWVKRGRWAGTLLCLSSTLFWLTKAELRVVHWSAASHRYSTKQKLWLFVRSGLVERLAELVHLGKPTAFSVKITQKYSLFITGNNSYSETIIKWIAEKLLTNFFSLPLPPQRVELHHSQHMVFLSEVYHQGWCIHGWNIQTSVLLSFRWSHLYVQPQIFLE